MFSLGVLYLPTVMAKLHYMRGAKTPDLYQREKGINSRIRALGSQARVLITLGEDGSLDIDIEIPLGEDITEEEESSILGIVQEELGDFEEVP